VAVLFAFSWFVLALSAACGYGAVFLGAWLGPALTRLDPHEAVAVAQVGYRIGARGAENACYLVGPAALGVLVAAPAGPGGYGPWPWVAIALWPVSLAVRSVVVQPGRRTVAVALGELAGAPTGSDGRRAQLTAATRRVRAGALVVFALFAVAVAVAVAGLSFGR